MFSRIPGASICTATPRPATTSRRCCDAIFGHRQLRNEIVWCYTRDAGAGEEVPSETRHHLVLHAKATPRRLTRSTGLTNCGVVADVRVWPDDVATTPTTSKRMVTVFDWDSSTARPSQSGVIPPDNEARCLQGWKSTPERLVVRHQNPRRPQEHAGARRLPHPETPSPSTSGSSRPARTPVRSMLDPFAGCATTLVAAERLGRQWVGIDLWEGAHEVILRRLSSVGFDTGGRVASFSPTWPTGALTSRSIPQRTDGGGGGRAVRAGH